MNYTPHCEEQTGQMLSALGLKTADELFADIPQSLRCRGLELPEPLANEARLMDGIARRTACDAAGLALKSYLGAGCYDHYVPAAVDALGSRGEFFTAYTPYQPEVSQGTLQSIFEYQSMVCGLFGMDVSNASGYDAATCLADAVLVASRVRKNRPRVLVSAGLHPEYRQTLATYTDGLELVDLPAASGRGTVDPEAVAAEIAQGGVCAVVVQSPNFFGCIEPMREVGRKMAAVPELFIAVVNPIALGILESPGNCGADIAVGDGQVLGNYMAFGGPHLGIYTCRQEYVRQMPGRVVGRTTDRDGKTAYVMTLRTREQDIRREKATSNICSNQALMALRACMYMAWLGKRGIGELARQNYSLAHYLRDRLFEIGGISQPFAAPFFNEFAISLPAGKAEGFRELMIEGGIVPGLNLGRFHKGMEDCLLIAVTEQKTLADLDDFAARAARAAAELGFAAGKEGTAG